MTRVLTIGSFDPLHADHMRLLQRCQDLGDKVTVGVNSDTFYQRYRGVPPMFKYTERKGMIEQLGFSVALNDGPGRVLIQDVMPHYLVVGSDWLKKDYLTQISVSAEELASWNVALVFVPRGEWISDTDLKRRAKLS